MKIKNSPKPNQLSLSPLSTQMASEFLFPKEKVPLTVNFNNFVTVNNFFNMSAPEQKPHAKQFFKAEGNDWTPKPFAKAHSQLFFDEKLKMPPALKPSKSSNEIIHQKSETCEEKPSVLQQEQVQIVEKRQMYNDYKAEVLGYLLLIGIFLFFTWFGVVFLLRMLDLRTNNVVFDFAVEDAYYCVLFPLIIPITTLAVYGNWVAMKFFRHS